MNRRKAITFLALAVLALTDFAGMALAKRKAEIESAPVKVQDDPGCHGCIARAAAMFSSGDTVNAAELLQTWRQRCPNNAHLRILLSTILMRGRTHLQEAEEVACEAAAIAPHSLLAHLQYAFALTANGKPAAAANQYERVVELNPGNYEAWSSLGKLYEETGQEAKASLAQKKAALLDPSQQTSRMRQLRSMLNLNHPSALDLELKRIVSSSDTAPETLPAIAEQALAVGDFEVALAAAERALSIYPDSPGPLQSRCLAQLFLGDVAAARDGADDIIARDPTAAKAYAVLSMSESLLAKLDAAEQDLAKARQLEPRSAVTQIALADMAYRQGRYNEAATSIQSALEGQQPQPEAHAIQAKIFLKQAKWDDAISETREMARFPGLQAAACGLEAQARLMDGVKDDARKAASLAAQAGQFSTESPEGIMAAAAVSTADGRPGVARSRLEQLLEKQPGNSDAIYLLSVAAKSAGNAQEQVRLLERCLTVAPGDPDACLALAAILLDEGSVDRAVELLRKTLLAHDDNPSALFLLGQALERKGNKDESIKFYKLCLTAGPSGTEKEGATEALKRLESGSDQP